MTSSSLHGPTSPRGETCATPTVAQALPTAARVVLGLLDALRHGTLDVQLPDGQTRRAGHGEPHASLHVTDWNVFTRALKAGEDRKSTRLNSSHLRLSRMPSSA